MGPAESATPNMIEGKRSTQQAFRVCVVPLLTLRRTHVPSLLLLLAHGSLDIATEPRTNEQHLLALALDHVMLGVADSAGQKKPRLQRHSFAVNSLGCML